MFSVYIQPVQNLSIKRWSWLYVCLPLLLYSMLMHMNRALCLLPCPLPVHHSAPHMPLPCAPLIQPLGAWLSLTCHQITHTKFTCIPRLSSCCRFVTKNKSWSSWLSRSGVSAASLIGRDGTRVGVLGGQREKDEKNRQKLHEIQVDLESDLYLHLF